MSITAHEDPLYAIFEEHLHSGLYDEVPLSRFVSEVVDFYWAKLSRNGHIPHHLHNLMKKDLADDVLEMLKAKTYGNFGIGEYNRIRRKKIS